LLIHDFLGFNTLIARELKLIRNSLFYGEQEAGITELMKVEEVW